jgi:hypothetical protein
MQLSPETSGTLLTETLLDWLSLCHGKMAWLDWMTSD